MIQKFTKAFFIAFLGTAASLQAQNKGDIFSDDYSDAAPWSQIGQGLSVSNGMVRAVRVPANFTVHKIFRNLTKPVTSDMDWVMEMEFTNTSKADDYNLSFIMALTPGTEDVGVVCSTISGPCVKQNPLLPRIFINYFSEANDDAQVNFAAYHPDSVGKAVDNVRVPRDQKVFFKLVKEGDLYTFNVFSDANRTAHMPGSPTKLRYKLVYDSFNVLQHSVNSGGGNHRMSSFDLDNFSLTSVPKVVTDLQEETAASSFIHLIPNPATDVLTVVGTQEEIQSIALLDIHGKEIMKSTGTKSILVKEVPKGVYVVKVSTPSREYSQKAVIE